MACFLVVDGWLESSEGWIRGVGFTSSPDAWKHIFSEERNKLEKNNYPFASILMSHLVENHPSPRMLGLVHVFSSEGHSHRVPHGRAGASTGPAPAATRRRFQRSRSHPGSRSISRCLRSARADE